MPDGSLGTCAFAAGDATQFNESRNMQHENRVLSRLGARDLTISETELVAGGIQVTTNVCTALETTAARPGDGDGCNGDHDLGI